MMSKYGILKDLEIYLMETIMQDTEEAERFNEELTDYDKGWHEGFNRAIEQVAIILDKYPQN